MSEIAGYIFEDPVNVSENPEAYAEFHGLLEAVMPARIEFMPEDVLSVSVERVIDLGVTLNLEIVKGDLGPIYTVELVEEYYFDEEPEILRMTRTRVISCDPESETISLVVDKQSEYDLDEEETRSERTYGSEVDSHSLYHVASLINSLPGYTE